MEPETAIPSASAVQVAKEKRERLRALGASSKSEDYISLSLSKRSDFSQGPHPESRLVREEDELGDADDGKYTCFVTISSYSYVSQSMPNTLARRNVSPSARSRRKQRQRNGVKR